MGGCSSSENDRNAVGVQATGEISQKDTAAKERELAANAAAEFMGISVNYTLVELSVSCSNLRRRDRTGHSDPFCVLSVADSESDKLKWKEVSRTEVISNCGSPRWVTKFLIHYHFEMVQKVLFEIYDCDSSYATSDATNMDLSKQEFLGRFETSMAAIVGSPNSTLSGEIEGGTLVNAPFGTLTIKSEEMANERDEITLQLFGENLVSDSSIMGLSPFFVLSKQNEDQSFVDVYKTEVVVNSFTPLFADIKGPIIRLVNGDLYRPLKITAYSYSSNGHHTYLGFYILLVFWNILISPLLICLGEVVTSLASMQEAYTDKSEIKLCN